MLVVIGLDMVFKMFYPENIAIFDMQYRSSMITLDLRVLGFALSDKPLVAFVLTIIYVYM